MLLTKERNGSKMMEYLISVIEIGLACSTESPKDRMSIDVVLRELHLVKNNILKKERSKVLTGKYYVVDSGYQNMPGFLTPYKGERYHLSLFRGRRRLPTKEEEWFNYHHSSLRNVIERYFGALKARFPILKQMPKGFSVRTQKYLPTACCTVHNFIRMHDKNDAVFKFYNKEDLIVESEQGRKSSSQQINVTPAQLREMARVRNTIARQIFNSQRL
ncbi:hypothetical protein RHSIM_Rhsim04G0049300 [Rhododendron simsii]|uniref:DDE Tnp4 domain-containing protein n=1 Tax=Rhododendron simsii TaxID=118357 RepID=A0A834LQE9_RHOSS|nr:hypothetical protein RHSIM_Rhsim04G0049300 [Rhododendron simsii]